MKRVNSLIAFALLVLAVAAMPQPGASDKYSSEIKEFVASIKPTS